MRSFPPLLQNRISDFEQMLSEKDISSAVVYARGSNLGPATKSHGYMRYLCDWDGHQNDSVLIITPGKPPVLLVTGIFSKFFSERYYWISDTRFIKPPQLGATIADICKSSGSESKKIGLVGLNEMPVSLWMPMNAALAGREFVDVSPYLDQQRLVKDAHQLSRHKAAAEVCDSLFETLRKEIHTPRPVFQLQAELEKVARYAGSEYCMTWLTVGPQADYCRFYKEECLRVPEKGDQVILGIYLMLDGYWGHAIRTGSMGAPSVDHQKVYQSSKAMWDGMLNNLAQGNDLASVHNAAEQVILSEYPSTHEQIFRFRHGHGLGHSYEDPISSLAFPQAYDEGGGKAQSVTAQNGMLFEIHPNLFVPGMGGSAIGDMVALSDSGNVLLTTYPRHQLDWTE